MLGIYSIQFYKLVGNRKLLSKNCVIIIMFHCGKFYDFIVSKLFLNDFKNVGGSLFDCMYFFMNGTRYLRQLVGLKKRHTLTGCV